MEGRRELGGVVGNSLHGAEDEQGVEGPELGLHDATKRRLKEEAGKEPCDVADDVDVAADAVPQEGDTERLAELGDELGSDCIPLMHRTSRGRRESDY